MHQQSAIQKIFLLILIVSSGFIQTSCCAQTIVGKWKLVSMNGSMVYKSSGKKVDMSKIKTDQVFEFKADKTYIQTNASGAYAGNGKYSISGDQLKMVMDTKGLTADQKKAVEKRNQISTLKFITPGNMTWHAVFNDDVYSSDVEMTLNKL